jgi:flagellin-like protein
MERGFLERLRGNCGRGRRSDRDRAASSVIGTVLLVAVAVTLSAAVGGFVLSGQDTAQRAPVVAVEHQLYQNKSPSDSDDVARITFHSGDAIRADRLLVVASKPVDIAGERTAANGNYASDAERFVESASGPPQVNVGDTWDAGEPVWISRNGDLEGVTVRIVWNPQPIEGQNPGTVVGEESHVIAEFTL